MQVVRFSTTILGVGAMASALLGTACNDDEDLDDIVVTPPPGEVPPAVERPLVPYRVTNLVTNATDPDLVNPWGLVADKGLFWIADNHTGKVSVYDGAGRTSPDHPTGFYNLGEGITGVTRNDARNANAFLIPCNGSTQTAPADLIFASEDGRLIAINNMSSTSGVTVVDRSAVGANYKGVAFLATASGPTLLAADFANRRIDVFDASFKLLNSATFVDPEMPGDWGPFNIVVTAGKVYMMEAKIGEGGDEVAGPGLGAVAIFDPNGPRITRLAAPEFNAPWGLAVAPAASQLTQGFDTIFVGNFGDGLITAFDARDLHAIGQLTGPGPHGPFIQLEGLWGLVIGDANGGSPNALYFASGPDDENAGLYGRIERDL